MKTRTSGDGLCTISLVNSDKMCRFPIARCLNSKLSLKELFLRTGILEGLATQNVVHRLRSQRITWELIGNAES